MSEVKTPTATAKPVAKTPVAKATAKPVAKKETTKATAKPVVKKEAEKKVRASRKGITRSFAADVTAAVKPVMANINALITNPATSEDVLKMIRLELRKSVRATRSTINTRKSTVKTPAAKATAVKA